MQGREATLLEDRQALAHKAGVLEDFLKQSERPRTPVELKTTLEQQKSLTDLVDASQLVVKTAAVKEALEECPASQLSRVQSTHSAVILASEEGLSLSRATPVPSS